MTRMRPSILPSRAIALIAIHQPVVAQRRPPARPQLEGVWNGATLTPLERPAGFEHRATFTPEEGAEFKRTSSDRTLSRLPGDADRLTQADIDETYVETEVFSLDRLRTSLIVDPTHGRLPDLLVAIAKSDALRFQRVAQ